MRIIYCLRIALFQNRPIVKKVMSNYSNLEYEKTLYISKA